MKPILKYALILGVIVMVWTPIEYLLGLHTNHIDLHPYITNLFFLAPIICLYLVMSEKKKINGGTLTYLDAFLTGLKMSVLVIPFSLVGQYIYLVVINPDFFTTMINYAFETAKNAGLNAETARNEAQAYFTFNNYMLQSLLGPSLGGALFSAIIGLFVRTKKNSQ